MGSNPTLSASHTLGSQRNEMPQPIRSGLQRLAYVAMSVLVAWHTFAMIIAPAPDNSITVAARALAQPYLTFFGLQNPWEFFAPFVSPGYRFSYVIEDTSGEKHTFTPADRLNRFDPNSIWMRDRYTMIMTMPDLHGEAAGATLCLEHASLNPVNVTLLEIQQKDFSPEDMLSGKLPLDAEFVVA
ncbi:MAG: hypothetical protein ACREDP_16650, partial [Bradyrhizobium sp.]